MLYSSLLIDVIMKLSVVPKPSTLRNGELQAHNASLQVRSVAFPYRTIIIFSLSSIFYFFTMLAPSRPARTSLALTAEGGLSPLLTGA